MQVKKFEAKTMKEALDLVKVHLGPEAIILSAKDSHRGFGLMGEKSVEVTAAVSEDTLRKKQFAEAKLREELRERFQNIPASQQRDFINRAARPRQAQPAPGPRAAPVTAGYSPAAPRAPATRRYIDIDDEEMTNAPPHPRQAAAVAAAFKARAVQSAPAPKPAPRALAAVPTPVAKAPEPSAEVTALENQVRELRALIERLQPMGERPATLHPGADQGLPFEMTGIYQRLVKQGVSSEVVTKLLRDATREMPAESQRTPALVDAWVVRRLLETIKTQAPATEGRYQVFVGATGQGKTTTLVKLASNILMHERRTIAIISLDTVKLGAADQLRLYAQILNVPFAIVRTPEEWQVAEKKLAHVQHILVDCPGYGLRSPEELDWLRRMLPPASASRRTHLVQSIVARDEEILDVGQRYQALGYDDVIFTRLDESHRQGAVLNFQDRFKVPLHSFTFGTRVPEDFELAKPQRVVDLLFKLSKVSR
jgi:flagellar biosynthesis protein FlhF